MKTISTLIAIALAGFLTACASPEYAQYAAAQSSIATSKAASDTARFSALAQIARDGDAASRVAAVMALALGTQSSGAQTTIQAPQANQALQWASILVPGLTQAYAINRGADVSINASNNAAHTSIATTAGFVGIAGKIQAPGSVITTTDRHDVVNPAPVVVPPVTVIEPTVIVPTVVPPVVQVGP